MKKPKLFCFYTPSHKAFFDNFLKPSAEKEYEINEVFFEKQLSDSGEYRLEGWRETQYNKVLAWKNAVASNMGEVIICCDVDIQFLKKSFSYFEREVQDYDIIYQENDLKGKICSGFFACKCSPKTEFFFSLVAEKLKAIMHEKGGGEQYVMQGVLDDGEVNLLWKKFPRDLVWNPGEKYSDVSELKVPDSIIVHHANWVEGNDNKKAQLEYVKSIFGYDESEAEPAQEEFGELQDLTKDPSSIAICLSSLLRFFDKSSESLIGNVITELPEPPDFFGHFPTKSLNIENIRLLKNILKYCNNFDIKFEEDVADRKYFSYDENLNRHQRNGMMGNIYQWVSMKKSRDLKINAENKFDKKYDHVIWARPDLYYFNEIPDVNSLKDFDIYFPSHDNHFCGIFDRFCIGKSEVMDKRMDILNYFVNEWYPKYHYDERYLYYNPHANSYQWNPELVLSDYMNVFLKIDYSKIDLCTGKFRGHNRCTSPFWHMVQGSISHENNPGCTEDEINLKVLEDIYTNYDIDLNSKNYWFEVFV
jgi:hypothetical protein